jgi:thiol-disulfide isomerase/thioredoxin
LKRREALVVAAVGLGAAAAGLLVATSRLTPDPAGELTTTDFTDLGGRPRRLTEWNGLIRLCNFWASWCAPCREEIPMLVDIRSEYAAKGVEIVGIGLDSRENVAAFVKSYPMPYPVLLGGAASIDLLRRLGNRVGALPYTVALNRRGELSETRLGEMKRADVQQMLGRLLV